MSKVHQDSDQSLYMVAKRLSKEIVIKKSRFICHVSPASSPKDAQRFIDEISKNYWDATHNVPAWRVGFPVPGEKFSDDGEPAGTAGMPVLEVLRKKDLTNTVVVVTRYFGGIMLGAGGLVRAYTESTVKGLAEAGIHTYRLHRRFQITVDYSFLGPLLHLLENMNAKVNPPLFEATVTVMGSVASKNLDKFAKAVGELGQGKLEVVWGEEEYICVGDKK